MPKIRTRRKRLKSKGQSRRPSTTQAITRLARTVQEKRYRLVLNYGTGLVSADGSGVLAQTFGSSPSNSPNWSDVTANWRQFVVLSFNVHFLPYEQYDKSLSTVTSPMYVAEDHRSSATPTATTVTSCARCQMKSAENAWNFDIHMTGIRELTPQDVGSPTSVAWVKLYTSGWAAAGAVGYFFVSYAVELRDIN